MHAYAQYYNDNNNYTLLRSLNVGLCCKGKLIKNNLHVSLCYSSLIKVSILFGLEKETRRTTYLAGS